MRTANAQKPWAGKAGEMCMDRRRIAGALLALTLFVPCAALADYTTRMVSIEQTEDAYVPPVMQSRSFALYDEGPTILLLKERLQALGYYQPMAAMNKKFDSTMRARVRMFQQNNDLPDTGVVDEDTIIALYSDHPVKGKWDTSDVEPARALIFTAVNSGQWYKSAEDEIGFRATVKNVSPARTVTAFEVSVYAEDAQGKRVFEQEKLVMEGDVKPGEKAWTTYVFMKNPESVRAAYVAITRVRFTDGTYALFDDPVYECWPIDYAKAP